MVKVLPFMLVAFVVAGTGVRVPTQLPASEQMASLSTEATDTPARQRTFSHQLKVGNPPEVFEVNPKGVITLKSARGQNASAFLRCEEHKLQWSIYKVGDTRRIERGCPNMELFANGKATEFDPVIVTIQVDD